MTAEIPKIRLPRLCVDHSGADPVWRGRPFLARIKLIDALTIKDTEDRQYFRTDPRHMTRRRLRTAEDYRALNRALDEWMIVSA